MALVDTELETNTTANTAAPTSSIGGSGITLAISRIRTDGGTQPRAEVSPATVEEYAEAMKANALFPPVLVFYDGQNYWLADGFHRLVAAEQAGYKDIAADVRQGTQRDAVLASVAANATHGLRRTTGDKYRAVETLLRDEEWNKWSDREIARRALVSHPFVARVRGELGLNLTGNISSDGDGGQASGERIYTTRHGTPATMQTTNIGTKPATTATHDSYPSPVPTPAPAPVSVQSPVINRATPPAPQAAISPSSSLPVVKEVEAEELVTAAPEAEAVILTSDDPVQNRFGCAACTHHATTLHNLTEFRCSYLAISGRLEERRNIGVACEYWAQDIHENWDDRAKAEGSEAALAVARIEVKDFLKSIAPHMADKVLASLASNPYLAQRWEIIKKQAVAMLEEVL